MKLYGMLDSPYVRRTAISFFYLQLPLQHIPLSVFTDFAEFQAINPVVKGPTLVTEDGTCLMDSTLMLDLAETLVHPNRRLMPAALAERQHHLCILGLALAACEKAVQLIYETRLRPAEKQHSPWQERVNRQLLAACKGLEIEIGQQDFDFSAEKVTQAGITSAVAWNFIQHSLANVIRAENYPALQQLSAQAEQTPAFLAFPPKGPGVVAT